MSEVKLPPLVVVTGLSGAGKSTALRALADLGFYCVDNLPPSLAQATVETCRQSNINAVALGMDVRVRTFMDSMQTSIEALKELLAPQEAPSVRVLYLLASSQSLVKRFSETRRPHPVLPIQEGDDGKVTLSEGIEIERERLQPILKQATDVMDTTHMSVHDLRRQVIELFASGQGAKMGVRVMSFGYKYGPPADANLVFDVRFLDNPHFVEGMRELTGNSDAVKAYVMAADGAAELLRHVVALTEFVFPRYEREGKSYVTVAIGCTGGRHRSVAIANELAQVISDQRNESIAVLHRDIRKREMLSVIPGGSTDRTRWSKPAARTSPPGPLPFRQEEK